MSAAKRSVTAKQAPAEPRKRYIAKDAAPVSRREPGGTRERLLAAAEEEFAAHGIRGARVQAIVERAGVNERMLYHYFGDKDGLYHAVRERFIIEVTDKLDAVLDAPGTADPEARFAELLRMYFDALAEKPSVVRLFLHDALAGWPPDERLMALRREMDARVTPKVTEFFAAAMRSGMFREGADPLLALLTAGSSFLVVLLSLPRIEQVFQVDLDDPAQRGAFRDRLIDTVLHGVVAPRR